MLLIPARNHRQWQHVSLTSLTLVTSDQARGPCKCRYTNHGRIRRAPWIPSGLLSVPAVGVYRQYPLSCRAMRDALSVGLARPDAGR